MRYLATALVFLLTVSFTAQVDCPNPYDGNGDGNVSIGDFLEMLSVFGDTDTDSDGVWDSLDDCVDLAACNYANAPSEPCAYLDVLGVCGGGCDGDGDGDGICDSEDYCVGVLDECGVCNGPGPTEVFVESITILYDSLYAEQIDEWVVFEIGADTLFNYTCGSICGEFIEHEGYDYSTVQIGDQCWFAENCRYLPEISSSYYTGYEGSFTEPHYYVLEFNGTDVETAKASENYQTYGVLYNWPAVMTDEICPSGWHMPSDEEFTELTDFLGGEEIAGEAMKSTSGWDYDNFYSSNSSGFSGLPGGRYTDGFGSYGGGEQGGSGLWWTTSPLPLVSHQSWNRRVNSYTTNVYRDQVELSSGASARCIKGYIDVCGVLNGDNSTCLDDCGIPNGDNSTCFEEDECGVPNGDNSTCTDNCGVIYGTNDCITCGEEISHEGYAYSTVQIGEQCWFSENCRYLPEVTHPNESSYTAPLYYVNNYSGIDVEAAKATANYATYGVLYNWPAVMTEGICPSGWHIPSNEEFTQLTDFLGGEEIAGDMMQDDEQWNGSNSSGFNGLEGGYYSCGSSFGWDNAYWWTTSEAPVPGPGADTDSFMIRLDDESIDSYFNSRCLGNSARCLKD